MGWGYTSFLYILYSRFISIHTPALSLIWSVVLYLVWPILESTIFIFLRNFIGKRQQLSWFKYGVFYILGYLEFIVSFFTSGLITQLIRYKGRQLNLLFIDIDGIGIYDLLISLAIFILIHMLLRYLIMSALKIEP